MEARIEIISAEVKKIVREMETGLPAVMVPGRRAKLVKLRNELDGIYAAMQPSAVLRHWAKVGAEK